MLSCTSSFCVPKRPKLNILEIRCLVPPMTGTTDRTGCHQFSSDLYSLDRDLSKISHIQKIDGHLRHRRTNKYNLSCFISYVVCLTNYNLPRKQYIIKTSNSEL